MSTVASVCDHSLTAFADLFLCFSCPSPGPHKVPSGLGVLSENVKTQRSHLHPSSAKNKQKKCGDCLRAATTILTRLKLLSCTGPSSRRSAVMNMNNIIIKRETGVDHMTQRTHKLSQRLYTVCIHSNCTTL